MTETYAANTTARTLLDIACHPHRPEDVNNAGKMLESALHVATGNLQLAQTLMAAIECYAEITARAPDYNQPF